MLIISEQTYLNLLIFFIFIIIVPSRYPSFFISEATLVKVFKVAKAHVCGFKDLEPVCFSPPQFFLYCKHNSNSGVIFRKGQRNKVQTIAVNKGFQISIMLFQTCCFCIQKMLFRVKLCKLASLLCKKDLKRD